MLDIHTRVAQLKRPALLARAARFGADEYRRDLHLGRLLASETLPSPAQALVLLLDHEAEAEAKRQSRAGDYAVARHVDLLIAISGEARLLAATRPQQSGAGLGGIAPA